MNTILTHQRRPRRRPVIVGLALILGLAGGSMGCSKDDGPARYRFTVRNATAAQPLSPPALVLHDDRFRGWALGAPASTALEALAEGGNAADFLQTALAIPGTRFAEASAGAVGPGETAEFTVETDHTSSLEVTVATMLVNTNDAFAGITGLNISSLGGGESLQVALPVYDAGTEANSEQAATIPGPAGGGEGFNGARDDVNFVAFHRGALTQAEGLSSSALGRQHRFQWPGALLEITRLD